jgi:hypothetical protein
VLVAAETLIDAPDRSRAFMNLRGSIRQYRSAAIRIDPCKKTSGVIQRVRASMRA